MTKPIARDPIYRKRPFDAVIIELCVRSVHHLSTFVPGSGRDDGGARHRGRA